MINKVMKASAAAAQKVATSVQNTPKSQQAPAPVKAAPTTAPKSDSQKHNYNANLQTGAGRNKQAEAVPKKPAKSALSAVGDGVRDAIKNVGSKIAAQAQKESASKKNTSQGQESVQAHQTDAGGTGSGSTVDNSGGGSWSGGGTTESSGGYSGGGSDGVSSSSGGSDSSGSVDSTGSADNTDSLDSTAEATESLDATAAEEQLEVMQIQQVLAVLMQMLQALANGEDVSPYLNQLIEMQAQLPPEIAALISQAFGGQMASEEGLSGMDEESIAAMMQQLSSAQSGQIPSGYGTTADSFMGLNSDPAMMALGTSLPGNMALYDSLLDLPLSGIDDFNSAYGAQFGAQFMA